MIDAWGLHGLSCKMSAGRSLRYFQINDLIFRSLKIADIPSTEEPNGLVRGDSKKPDGLTWCPWKAGKAWTWNAAIADKYAVSYLKASPVSPGLHTAQYLQTIGLLQLPSRPWVQSIKRVPHFLRIWAFCFSAFLHCRNVWWPTSARISPPKSYNPV